MVSTPAVRPCSGWPGVFEPSWRKRWSSSSGQAVAGQVEQGVELGGGVAAGEDEAVPIRPVGPCRVGPEVAGPEGEGHGRLAHGRAGVAGLGLLDHVDRQEADRVDGGAVAVGEGAVVGHGERPRSFSRESDSRSVPGSGGRRARVTRIAGTAAASKGVGRSRGLPGASGREGLGGDGGRTGGLGAKLPPRWRPRRTLLAAQEPSRTRPPAPLYDPPSRTLPPRTARPPAPDEEMLEVDGWAEASLTPRAGGEGPRELGGDLVDCGRQPTLDDPPSRTLHIRDARPPPRTTR